MSFGGKREDNGFLKKKMIIKDVFNKDIRELVLCFYRFNDDFDEDEKKKEKRLIIIFKCLVVFYKIDYMRKCFRMFSL